MKHKRQSRVVECDGVFRIQERFGSGTWQFIRYSLNPVPIEKWSYIFIPVFETPDKEAARNLMKILEADYSRCCGDKEWIPV